MVNPQQRLNDIARILTLWEKKRAFLEQKEPVLSCPNQQFQVQQSLQEIHQNIERYSKEYLQLLVQSWDDLSLNVGELATDNFKQDLSLVATDYLKDSKQTNEIHIICTRILSILESDQSSCNSQIKAVLPLLPALLTWELSLDTPHPKEIWRSVVRFIRGRKNES